MEDKTIAGVVAAVPTPIDESGEPDTERFVAHCLWALENGCDALNVLGTTGEANSLSTRQRQIVMEAAAGRLDVDRLMVGTGSTAIETTVHLTRLAHELGFNASLVLPPFYYKPVSDDGLFVWFSHLLEATADTPIGVYLYNFPQLTGIRFSPELARRLVQAFPTRIRGAKDSSGDLEYAAVLAKIVDFEVFPSNEAALSQAKSDGFAGCISATVNVEPQHSADLWRDQQNPNHLQKVSSLRQAISSQPLIPAVKYLVGRRNDDPNWERLVPPHLPLLQKQKQALKASGLSFA